MSVLVHDGPGEPNPFENMTKSVGMAEAMLKHPGHGDQSVHGHHGGGHGGSAAPSGGGAPSMTSYNPQIGPSASEKIKNAEIMFGTGSKQHKKAIERFGSKAKAEAAARG